MLERSAPAWDRRGIGAYPERVASEPGALDRLLTAAYGRVKMRFERGAAKLSRRAALIDAQGAELKRLDEAGLSELARTLRVELVREGLRDDLVHRSFALVRELSHRLIGLRHYQVQLMGGLALVGGRLAEMQTGEGKTITAGLAAATAAMAGAPVHVVTVNDYLAARDARLLGPVYRFLGLSVGVVEHGQSPEDRRAAYACDITYAVNKEIAFDYLRDRIALGVRTSRTALAVDRLQRPEAAAPLLLRGLCCAILDEADSILVDEARTPLIISGPGADDQMQETYALALAIADRLVADEDFVIVENGRVARLTERGGERVRVETEAVGGLWRARRARLELVESALAARRLYEYDRHYTVRGGEVKIIDEHTGRIGEGRKWQHGLHQLIELKEGLAATARNDTLASITYQRFFARYQHLCGMSGTLLEVAPELRAVYGIETVRIPANRPGQRRDLGAQICPTRADKWLQVKDAVERETAVGRPVLVGTRSVRDSEELSAVLQRAGIDHTVLNAKHDEAEAEIVALAGEPGRVTVATNMAGRGTDIKLAEGVAVRGGLHVILTEYHEARRIDRQLVGRAGRQGDPGSFEAIVSFDDEIFAAFAPHARRLTMRLGPSPLPPGFLRVLRRHAQSAAERAHGRARAEVLKSQRLLDRTLAFSGRRT